MRNKYLNGLVKEEDLPENWLPDDERQEKWEQQRKEYGFDERETWSLDYSFRLWFYQRLKMYNEVNKINTSFHKVKFEDKEYTQQQCIDYILEMLELTFKDKMWDEDKEKFIKVDKACRMIGYLLPYLWW